MNYCARATTLFLAPAVFLFVVAGVSAQSLTAPANLSADGNLLSWSASSGAGVRYLIERSGPGLTFFTQIAGPISDPRFLADTKESEYFRGARYTYRVRAIDSASNLSPYSNSISIPLEAPIRNLPLVGNDPIALLTTLPGYRANPLPVNAATSDSTSFVLRAVKDRTLSFTSADSSQSFSWGCMDCSFVVGPDGVGPADRGNRGMVFKLSPDGEEILATCRAAKCTVTTTAPVVRETQLDADQTIIMPATNQAFFTITTR